MYSIDTQKTHTRQLPAGDWATLGSLGRDGVVTPAAYMPGLSDKPYMAAYGEAWCYCMVFTTCPMQRQARVHFEDSSAHLGEICTESGMQHPFFCWTWRHRMHAGVVKTVALGINLTDLNSAGLLKRDCSQHVQQHRRTLSEQFVVAVTPDQTKIPTGIVLF